MEARPIINHVHNWFGLVFLAHSTMKWVLPHLFLPLFFPYKSGTTQLVGRNRITRYETIIYSKTCVHLHLDVTLLYYPIKPHPYQDILLLI